MEGTFVGSSLRWLPAPHMLRVWPDEVHVWRAGLDVAPARVDALYETLDPGERQRAARFHFARDRDRFIVGRGTLRALLARYLGGAPARLGFSYGPHGKPALSGEVADVRFNLSHAAGVALYAVAVGREVGIDVEAVRPDFATDQIAERFFSPAERQALRGVEGESRGAAFFACWTRKEAYIKARGQGLSLPLDSFDVTLVPGEPAALLATRDDPGQRDRWWLSALDAGPGFAAALTIEGQGCTLRCWQWSDVWPAEAG